MIIPRHAMPQQPPASRRENFGEVALGYPLEVAIEEANRCLQCATSPCIGGCPVEAPIPQFIKALREGDVAGAAQRIKDKNNLPAICGRVCPQESQCESRCVLGQRGKPVAIGRLERFVADWEMAHTAPALFQSRRAMPSTGKRVAVIGSGPAGLTCAADLAKVGHSVEIFEALHEPGGVLVYGIPEFRLPKRIVAREVAYVESLGVAIHVDAVIGKLFTVDEMLDEKGFDAVFLATGAGLPSFMQIPGINSVGVYSANEFLTRINLMKGYRFPEYGTPVHIGGAVAVIGAGNVAMDAARCALRIGELHTGGGHAAETAAPPEVTIVYRRSRSEVPARAEELEHAEQEGIRFEFLTSPVEILADEKGWVRGLRCIRTELGEPDAEGRRRPIPVANSEFEMPVATVIMALGTRPNPVVFGGSEGLERTRRGTVETLTDSGRTTKRGVWAGGDLATGAATVISAMGAGKRAAADIARYLSTEGTPDWSTRGDV
jgi:glutamate synthase (NADPH/NADH) small chain